VTTSCVNSSPAVIAGLWIAAISRAAPEIEPADRVDLYVAHIAGPNEDEIAEAMGEFLTVEGSDFDAFCQKGRRAFHALDVSALARSRWNTVCKDASIDVDPVEAFIELGVIWHGLCRKLTRLVEDNASRSRVSLAPAP
jgi:hypothetical protein